MKAKTFFCFLLVFVVISANGQDRGPVAVSPGSDEGIARVVLNCPTFSWTAAEWATGYKVVVFETNGPNVLDYEEMAAISSPVLNKEIQGRALSWTPSSDERLSNGSMFVWYVQALNASGHGIWSEGRMFKIDEAFNYWSIEERIRERLKNQGVSEEIIDDVLEDMWMGKGEVIAYGLDTKGLSDDNQGTIRIQDIEGEEANNTFFGLGAGSSLTGTGLYNSLFGNNAGFNTSTGDYNTLIGYGAGHDNVTGNNNTFVGFYSGYNNTASGNTFVGYGSGTANTSGSTNTFVGYDAGMTNNTGSGNTFVGSAAGISNSANWNTFMGAAAGYSNNDGVSNTFVGFYAGNQNLSGNGNTFIGKDAGTYSESGSYNTFTGELTGFNNTTGTANTFIGRAAGMDNTEGSHNTYLGLEAGHENQTGNYNVFLGYGAGYNETGSNRLYIDNSSTSSPLIWGNFASNILTIHGKLGIGTKSPAYAMELETTGENAAFVAQRTDGATNYINATAGFGNFGTVTNHPLRLAVNSAWRMRLDSDNSLTMANGAMCTAGGTWQNYSRREAKENIHDLTTEEAMDTLNGLVAVKYNYKVDNEEKHVGFIAEDVPELVASKDRNGISAMDIVAVLTKVVQEQQRLAEEQQKTISELQKQIDELKDREK